MPDIPQSDYDSATAVFSRSFRFVEWKYVIALKGGTGPFGDRNAPAHMAVKPIDRTKWIYVFRQDVGEEYAAIKEEIRVDANGYMFATPSDRIEFPIAKRGIPVDVGKTMSLPRRLLGKPKTYRFYASRLRLPLAQVKALEKTISTFVPRTLLDPANNSSVIEHDGQLLVPVVDPVTVALYLHAAFCAAADDVINYTAAHTDLPPGTRKTVEGRRKKHLLATLLKGIIGDKKNVGANNLVHQLKDQQGPLEEFLIHYDRQLEWRVKRRDWLANVLVSWLRSDAFTVAAAAHKAIGKDSWVRFLVPWCHVVTRLFEAPIGRTYLAGLLDDKSHFIHTFVWPQKKLTDDEVVQAVRKGGMAIVEAWAEFAATRVLIKGGDYVPEVVESLRNLLRLKQAQKLTAQSLKEITAIDRTISAVKLIDPGPVETVHHFPARVKSVGALIESINLVLAIKQTADALQGDDPQTKELALINLVGSSLDASSAIASLLQKESVAGVLGFVSGVIDVYLGVIGMNKAFADGDQDVANGQFLIAAGATFGTAGAAIGLLAIPGGQAVVILGLAIVAIGQIYRWLKGKEPLERFFEHCSWGKNHKLPGGADWSPTRFEQWAGDKEFDYQLEALLNIICKVDIDYYDTFRDLKFKAGWLPLNSKLVVLYQETWRNAAQPFKVQSEILLTHKGPTSKDARLAVTADGQNGIRVKVISGVPSTGQGLRTWPYRTPLLENVFAAGSLVVSFEGASPVRVPHDRPVKRTF